MQAVITADDLEMSSSGSSRNGAPAGITDPDDPMVQLQPQPQRRDWAETPSRCRLTARESALCVLVCVMLIILLGMYSQIRTLTSKPPQTVAEHTRTDAEQPREAIVPAVSWSPPLVAPSALALSREKLLQSASSSYSNPADIATLLAAPHIFVAADYGFLFGGYHAWIRNAILMCMQLRLRAKPGATHAEIKADAVLPILIRPMWDADDAVMPNQHSLFVLLHAYNSATWKRVFASSAYTGPILTAPFFRAKMADVLPFDASRLVVLLEHPAFVQSCDEGRAKQGWKFRCLLAPAGVDTTQFHPVVPRAERNEVLFLHKTYHAIYANEAVIGNALTAAGVKQFDTLRSDHQGRWRYKVEEYEQRLANISFLVAYSPGDMFANVVREAHAMDVPVFWISYGFADVPVLGRSDDKALEPDLPWWHERLGISFALTGVNQTKDTDTPDWSHLEPALRQSLSAFVSKVHAGFFTPRVIVQQQMSPFASARRLLTFFEYDAALCAQFDSSGLASRLQLRDPEDAEEREAQAAWTKLKPSDIAPGMQRVREHTCQSGK